MKRFAEESQASPITNFGAQRVGINAITLFDRAVNIWLPIQDRARGWFKMGPLNRGLLNGNRSKKLCLNPTLLCYDYFQLSCLILFHDTHRLILEPTHFHLRWKPPFCSLKWGSMQLDWATASLRQHHWLITLEAQWLIERSSVQNPQWWTCLQKPPSSSYIKTGSCNIKWVQHSWMQDSKSRFQLFFI